MSVSLTRYHLHTCEYRRVSPSGKFATLIEHVCGLPEYGALDDYCPGCMEPSFERDPNCTCGLSAEVDADRAALVQEMEQVKAIFESVLDRLDRHTRGFIGKRTTLENLAELVDGICKTDARHVYEKQHAEAALAASRQEGEKLIKQAHEAYEVSDTRRTAAEVDLAASRQEVERLKTDIRELTYANDAQDVR